MTATLYSEAEVGRARKEIGLRIPGNASAALGLEAPHGQDSKDGYTREALFV